VADPAVTQFVGGRPLSEEEAWVKFLRNAGTGRFSVSASGFSKKIHRRLRRGNRSRLFPPRTHPAVENLREAGWILSPAMHGKGYATEA